MRIGTVDTEVRALSISHRLRRTTFDHSSWHTCTNATIFPSLNAKVIALFLFLFYFIFTNATIFPSLNAMSIARVLSLHTCSPFTLLLLDIARSPYCRIVSLPYCRFASCLASLAHSGPCSNAHKSRMHINCHVHGSDTRPRIS